MGYDGFLENIPFFPWQNRFFCRDFGGRLVRLSSHERSQDFLYSKSRLKK